MSKQTDLLIIGAGPAGLGAAVEFAGRGGSVMIVDENERQGGQLFKQIHKFFGSSAHYAGTRGIDIGLKLVEDAAKAGAKTMPGFRALGLLRDGTIPVSNGIETRTIEAKRVLIAAGGKENAVSFPGWTLPGVMTAGSAQTFCNVHRVLPAGRPVMLGSGNVGLIVSYQLLQAGADVRGIVEIRDSIGGYEVHAAKVHRAGVPIFLNHKIVRAMGSDRIESVEIADINSGKTTIIETDGVFLAAGLTPRTELAAMFGCRLVYEPALGGFLPCHDDDMRSSVPDVFIAGDAAGIEEANTALDEGRLAGVAAAADCGLLSDGDASALKTEIRERLRELRSGAHSIWRLEAKKRITGTEAGNNSGAPGTAEQKNSEYNIADGAELAEAKTPDLAGACDDIENTGFNTEGYSKERLSRGALPVIDCPEPIPCNPCIDVCPVGAISMKAVCDRPVLDTETCTGCGLCITICPGLAIRTVKLQEDGQGKISIPYEYLPLPEEGQRVRVTNTAGDIIGSGTVDGVKTVQRFDKTAVVSLTVPTDLMFQVRGFKAEIAAATGGRHD